MLVCPTFPVLLVRVPCCEVPEDLPNEPNHTRGLELEPAAWRIPAKKASVEVLRRLSLHR